MTPSQKGVPLKKIKIALSLALLPILAHADGELALQDSNTPSMQNPPAVYLQYNNRMAVFGPLHQVYERIQPKAFYAGVEAWLLGLAHANFKANAIGEAELRLGYNFFYNGRDHVTPFVGAGAIKNYHIHGLDLLIQREGSHHRFTRLPTVAYGVIGFLYDHEFNTVVNLGFNLKGIIGGGTKKRPHDWGSPVVGFDAALPLTFRFGYQRHWDIRIEPFDIYLHGTNITVNYFGFRSTLGYRF